jgi:hypothetical protein
MDIKFTPENKSVKFKPEKPKKDNVVKIKPKKDK